MVQASLANKMKVLTLCDSGASRSVISKATIASCSYLSYRTTKTINPIKFQVGNGAYMIGDQEIEFDLYVQGKIFTVVAVIVDNLGCIDLILGNNTLKKLHAVLDFTTNKLKIKAKSILVKPNHNLNLHPGEKKTLLLAAEVPNCLKNAALYLQSSKFLQRYAPSNMCIKMKHSKCMIMVCNTSNKPVTISKHKAVGSIVLKDMYKIMVPAKIQTEKDRIMSVVESQMDSRQMSTKQGEQSSQNLSQNLYQEKRREILIWILMTHGSNSLTM